MNDKSQKLKIDLSFLGEDSDNKIKHQKQNNKEEYVWTCDSCGKEFDTEKECDEHEKMCKSQNDKAEKVFCIKCGTENQKDANYCKKCGSRIIENEETNSEITNKKENIKVKNLEKGDKRFKAIHNAGTSAEALGWFNLVFSIILLFIGMIGGADGIYMFGLICTIVVSYMFIKHGKILKKVNNVSIVNVTILLWTCLGIVVVAIFTEGSIGFLFLLELFYLFKAKSVINKLT